MVKRSTLTVFIACAVLCAFPIAGCGKEKVLPPAASKESIMEGNVTRAKPLLDLIEKSPAEERQAMANSPKFAEALKAAASDPSIQQRMASLGIHFPP